MNTNRSSMDVAGISLQHFIIYSPQLSKSEGDEHLQLLYYVASNTLTQLQKDLQATKSVTNISNNIAGSDTKPGFFDYFSRSQSSPLETDETVKNKHYKENSSEHSVISSNESSERIVPLEDKLKQMGLSQALVQFSSTFNPSPIYPLVIKTKKSISIIEQIEKGVFAVLCVCPPRIVYAKNKTQLSNLVSKNGLQNQQSNSVPTNNQAFNVEYFPDQVNVSILRNFLKTEFSFFTLLHGSISAKLKTQNEVKDVKKSLNSYFSKNVWGWNERWTPSNVKSLQISTNKVQDINNHETFPKSSELGLTSSLGSVPRMQLSFSTLFEIENLWNSIKSNHVPIREMLIFNKTNSLVYSSILDSFNELGQLSYYQNDKQRLRVNNAIHSYVRKLFSNHFTDIPKLNMKSSSHTNLTSQKLGLNSNKTLPRSNANMETSENLKTRQASSTFFSYTNLFNFNFGYNNSINKPSDTYSDSNGHQINDLDIAPDDENETNSSISSSSINSCTSKSSCSNSDTNSLTDRQLSSFISHAISNAVTALVEPSENKYSSDYTPINNPIDSSTADSPHLKKNSKNIPFINLGLNISESNFSKNNSSANKSIKSPIKKSYFSSGAPPLLAKANVYSSNVQHTPDRSYLTRNQSFSSTTSNTSYTSNFLLGLGNSNTLPPGKSSANHSRTTSKNLASLMLKPNKTKNSPMSKKLNAASLNSYTLSKKSRHVKPENLNKSPVVGPKDCSDGKCGRSGEDPDLEFAQGSNFAANRFMRKKSIKNKELELDPKAPIYIPNFGERRDCCASHANNDESSGKNTDLCNNSSCYNEETSNMIPVKMYAKKIGDLMFIFLVDLEAGRRNWVGGRKDILLSRVTSIGIEDREKPLSDPVSGFTDKHVSSDIDPRENTSEGPSKFADSLIDVHKVLDASMVRHYANIAQYLVMDFNYTAKLWSECLLPVNSDRIPLLVTDMRSHISYTNFSGAAIVPVGYEYLMMKGGAGSVVSGDKAATAAATAAMKKKERLQISKKPSLFDIPAAFKRDSTVLPGTEFGQDSGYGGCENALGDLGELCDFLPDSLGCFRVKRHELDDGDVSNCRDLGSAETRNTKVLNERDISSSDGHGRISRSGSLNRGTIAIASVSESGKRGATMQSGNDSKKTGNDGDVGVGCGQQQHQQQERGILGGWLNFGGYGLVQGQSGDNQARQVSGGVGTCEADGGADSVGDANSGKGQERGSRSAGVASDGGDMSVSGQIGGEVPDADVDGGDRGAGEIGIKDAANCASGQCSGPNIQCF
ncbi:hypothetical protein AYI70_g1153 [Smittium culicis]|uniref:CCZ1/INTU/HSP4 first Longin domain-containing protein n=1 Tax=Smittium culicis TaxID=133412 RepID=A0A1R1YDT4_9FUNG|nr:hypothetical protein AYI70_g1153 [Smittium culicis]